MSLSGCASRQSWAMYSLEMYSEAAELCHPDALYKLGRVSKDKAKRAEYLRRAADLGNIKAKEKINDMVRKGESDVHY